MKENLYFTKQTGEGKLSSSYKREKSQGIFSFARKALLTIVGVFVLAASCAPAPATSTRTLGTTFEGNLSYPAEAYDFFINDEPTLIGLSEIPTVAAADAGVEILYSLEAIEGTEGTEFAPPSAVSINESTGELTINPATTNIGTATYRISAKAEGYTTLNAVVAITINLRVTGSVTDLTATAGSTSLTVAWTAPLELGMKPDITELALDELEYRVYYVAGTSDQDVPSAETVMQEAAAASQVETVTGGITRIEIPSLTEGTRYFVAVEAYNSFTETGTLSDTVAEGTINVLIKDFGGSFAYDVVEYEFLVNDAPIRFNQSAALTTDAIDNAEIRYSIEAIGTGFTPSGAVSISETTGEISINPATTSVGIVLYRATASAENYAPQIVDIAITINLRVTGSATNLAVSPTSDSTSFTVQWAAPVETGMKPDTTVIEANELQYRVYYVSRTADQDVPSAETVMQEAVAASQVVEVTGSTNTDLTGLESDTQYFVALETYNSFTDEGVLLDTVVGRSTDVQVVEFTGNLTYTATEHEFFVGDASADIVPSGRPTAVPLNPSDPAPVIGYSLERITGTVEFSPLNAIGIDSETGNIRVNPNTTNTGEAVYRVSAKAENHVPQIVEITIRILPRVSGAVTGVTVFMSSGRSDVLLVRWTRPTETGTKPDTTVLEANELEYRVYYVAGAAGQAIPDVATVKQDAEAASQVETVTGNGGDDTGLVILTLSGLEAGTRYFLAIETYNSFTDVSTLIDTTAVGTTTTPLVDFGGGFAYSATEFEYLVNDATRVIDLDQTPTVATATTITYSLSKIEGVDFPPSAVSLNASTGTLTVNPATTNTGSATYQISASATGYTTITTEVTIRITPRVSGPVTGLNVFKSPTDNSILLAQWIAPVEKGTKEDGTVLDDSELVYRIYYAAGVKGETVPTVATVKQNAALASQIEIVTGVRSAQLSNLAGDTRYYVIIETYNPYTNVSTLINTVSEATTEESVLDFIGALSYARTDFSLAVGSSSIEETPDSLPITIGGPISYVLTKIDGTDFSPDTAVSIDQSTGVISIDPNITNFGTTNYFASAVSTGYNTQSVRITVSINRALRVTSSYYSSSAMDVPIVIGQVIKDATVLGDQEAIFSIGDALEGNIYTVHVGNTANIISSTPSITRLAVNGVLELSKSDLSDLENDDFSFIDGAAIGIAGPGIDEITHVATYRPSEIYGWQDLQAIRVNKDGNYVLKRDIVFPPDSGYETVRFLNGSIDGANGLGGRYSISNLQIQQPSSAYQGLFGTIQGPTPSTVVASNLILRDFNIEGLAFVGALAGAVTRGSVESVSVEVVNGSQITVADNENSQGEGGGLIGSLGTFEQPGVITHQAFVIDSNSAATVMGAANQSVNIGGLVGQVQRSVVTGSYATGTVQSQSSSVGGLVGYNIGGIISGYATGDVRGAGDFVGGLVGNSVTSGAGNSGGANISSRITGYATGNVQGKSRVGGLVGTTASSGYLLGGNIIEETITGYALGDVTGATSVGGIVGHSDGSVILAYGRGNVVRSSGTAIAGIGPAIGSLGPNASGSQASYVYASNFADESKVYDSDGTTGIATVGAVGVAVSIVQIAFQGLGAFSDLSFGTELGEWTWVGGGEWPAINIGEIAPADAQPTE